ncbi:hypothetical protein DSOUD_1826 [Desulfuromonas soudanensis]|uniref:Uncharacterized protein n=1 Tax=Desulfuromonas soudanensis TaxID=1603606 RepID=A0A0M3QFP7_9BACT|nr:hypothetical protein [Desulfuromonas soudanensis]ALC16599.1 hypothetical protein DSOUD_1826 [Desulfuromonas soudanensis]
MSRLGVSALLDTEGFPLFSLLEINRLPPPVKERIYSELVPEELFDDFAIDRQTFAGADGRRKIEFICPAGLGLLRLQVRHQPGDRDFLFFVELADTPYRQMELSFCLVNDPLAPRFDIDVDPFGRDNCFGTLRRNIPEEIRAMEAGLSPNQVRKGLKLFSPFFQRLERFVDALGMDTIVAEPLSYNNAIRYEKYGFDYIAGQQLMRWIDREFRPGGELYRRLDGSTPFRRPGMEQSVRGRSWAIHDGILHRPWDGVKIYKTLGIDAGIDSFPGRTF